MDCPYCKADNDNGTRYCSNCGRLLATPLVSRVPDASTIPAPPIVNNPSGSDNTVYPTILEGTTSSSLVSGSRLQGGRYIVKHVLGQGGMGAALLATDIRLDSKLVVIKELISDSSNPTRQQEDIRNFKREVSTLAHIDHPLIPSVTDHFQEGPRYFMVQEYVEGENLEVRMDRTNQPMKEREVLICASEILDILSYLAQQTPPIVHRDIKPANVIVGARDRRAHLVDFGIARNEAVSGAQHKHTAALGTPGYAPPEQYQGNVDPRSDLYALAAMLHHLLTNRDPRQYPPFNFPPACSLNPDLSLDSERVLQRGLVNDRNQRYQSASSMKQDVDAILRQRFGLSGNIDSYTLGTSGTSMTMAPAIVPNTPNPMTPVQPLSQLMPSQTPLPIVPPRRRRTGLIVGLLLLVLLLVGGSAAAAFLFLRPSTSGANPIHITKVGDESIGISDGSFVFDSARADGSLKEKAAQALQTNSGNASATAVSYLSQAVDTDSNDAEAHIYLENQNVLSSGSPYITLVVATMISGGAGFVGVGRDTLQGAYVAQKEYNDGSKLPNGVKVRLLIANTGSQLASVPPVAQQIVQLAQKDKTFVGVMGWPYSDRTYDGIKILAAAHIPLVSQTASSDILTGISPYFFRVAPSNNMQGIAGADYAFKTLDARKVALFYDQGNIYSQSLAQDFARQFKVDGGEIVVEEQYTVGKPANLGSLLQEALTSEPDLIYFSGYAADVNTLLVNLPAGDLPVLGGDALYQLSGYTSSSKANGFSHLRFTAFAYPDEWGILGYGGIQPAFFSEYPAAFDPNKLHQGSPYGFTREDNDVILSYDATIALLNGCAGILTSPGKIAMTPQDLQRGLQGISGTHGFQGVSGQIAFDQHGDPVNKAIVVLYVDSVGNIHMERGLGQFLKDKV
jgi:serine/threonine protein kinase/ABC-type branched-subunit amino acid transport system substrate-binding protein